MTCKDCILNKICSTYVYVGDDGDICPYFADNSQYIKLPCKVGDTVYVNRRCLYIPHQTRAIEPICECKVIAFKKNNRGVSMLVKPINTGCAVTRVSYQWVVISAIGITVFLDRESAEKDIEGA